MEFTGGIVVELNRMDHTIVVKEMVVGIVEISSIAVKRSTSRTTWMWRQNEGKRIGFR
ncbi:hypothetical protein U1Q18_049405, partial [Sarracenia purpurea var. burkii]